MMGRVDRKRNGNVTQTAGLWMCGTYGGHEKYIEGFDGEI
jgi:hypothetical protein